MDAHRPTPNMSGHALALQATMAARDPERRFALEPWRRPALRPKAGVRRKVRGDMTVTQKRGRKERRAAARGRRFLAPFRISTDSADPGLPAAQGLYDPALDKDSCGVGFIADIKGRKSHQIVEDALTILLQSRTSRRGRRRSARRRRRRHPGADPAQVLRQGSRASSASRCRSPANTPSASCSCRAIRTGGRSSATSTRR